MRRRASAPVRRWAVVVAARATILTSAAAIAATAAPAPAHGYARFRSDSGTPMRWFESCVFITPSTNPSPDLTADQIAATARSSLDVWDRDTLACTYLDLKVLAPSPDASFVRADGVNSLVFRQARWCREPARTSGQGDDCYDPSALALTSVFLRNRPGDPEDGRILDSDVEVNGVNFRWSNIPDGGDPGGQAQDLANTLTHEFGHLIGLDHTCYTGGAAARPTDHTGNGVPDCAAASPDVRSTTMFASTGRGDLDKRTLEPDDQLAVCETYPIANDPARCVGVDLDGGDGCSTAGGGAGSAGGLWAVAATAALALAATRARRLRPRGRRQRTSL